MMTLSLQGLKNWVRKLKQKKVQEVTTREEKEPVGDDITEDDCESETKRSLLTVGGLDMRHWEPPEEDVC